MKTNSKTFMVVLSVEEGPHPLRGDILPRSQETFEVIAPNERKARNAALFKMNLNLHGRYLTSTVTEV